MKFPSNKIGKRGFTLIELLVVIAIIGLLSSVVLSSLNGARQRGRDARRAADLKQLQVALELYYGQQANPRYPNGQGQFNSMAPGLIAVVPRDPLNNDLYTYAVSANSQYYCMGATFEDAASIPRPADACDNVRLGGTEPVGNFRVGP